MNGAEWLVRELQRRGVDFVSVLCGNGLDPLLDASRRAGLRLIDTRNEQAASYIADAYARLMGRLGVCAVSSAVGHANALIGVVNAHFDGAPLLLITGASPQQTRGLGQFQELDHIPIVRSLCKYARWVERVDQLDSSLEQAIGAATTGRPGPVHLTVPLDVLEAPVQDTGPQGGHTSDVVRTVPHSPLARGDEGAIREGARMIVEATRPVLVVGTGAFYAGAGEAVMVLAEAAGVPTVVPIWDRGVIDRPIRQFLGVIGAASGGPELLPDADLIIYLGARIDYRTGYARPPAIRPDARIIRVDVDANELCQGREPDLPILGDPRSVAEQLIEGLREIGARPHTGWCDEARRRDQAFRRKWVGTPTFSGPPMTGRHVVEALRPFTRGDAIFLIDGGNIGQWAHMTLCDRYPSTWLTCGASAVVGWGLSGAMAARLAAPDRPVILLSGDGAATFTIAELESAARQGLPFVMVVADDQAWGIVVSGQMQRYGRDRTSGSRLGPIRFDQVAQGFGALGVRVECPEEIGPAVERGLTADRPTVVHVPIAPGGPADFGGDSL